MTARKWEWAVMQTFRGGHTAEITRRPTKREAEEAAQEIGERHAAIHGHAVTFTKRRAYKPKTSARRLR